MSEQTQRWTIGAATITALTEAETAGIPPQLFFPTLTNDTVRSIEWLGDEDGIADPSGAITFRVQAFVVEMNGRTVLVDPCVGNGKQRSLPFWHDLSTPWLDRFHAAGFREDGIDTVVHTHLHEDHLGWDTQLTDGTWTPTFTRARHVYVGNELDWAATEERRQGQDPHADSIEPILDAGLADAVEADADLGDGFRLISTPGHTPGHVSMVIDCGGDGLVVSGDLMHHQLQCADATIAEVADWDVGLAARTRFDFIDTCCASGTVVAGTHFPVAPLGRFERHDSAWRFRRLTASDE
jgi:glyoxylase-like metal-dependent hydrolase (beta-lactamase superfamily II)